MSGPPLLSIEGLEKTYGGRGLFGTTPEVRALDGVSLAVEAGSIHGIVGESGCGKSTLARIVMALESPSAGKVLLSGEDLHSVPAARLAGLRRDFQMVFQDPYGSLDPRHRVGRIVAEPLHLLKPRPSRAERRRRVAEVLEEVGLRAEDAEKHPHEFSGGQRQRIAIARALATRPKLLVADEAVSALDLSVQAQVLNLLMDLQEIEGLTILFISHNLAVVEAICDEVTVMHRGRIVETGPASEVLDRPLHPYSRELAEAEPSIERIGRPDRTARVTLPGPPPTDGCLFRHRCPLAQDICVERPPLREIEPGRRSACHFAERLQSASPEPVRETASS